MQKSLILLTIVFVLAGFLLTTIAPSPAQTEQKRIFTCYNVVQTNCPDCRQRCQRYSEDIKYYTASGWKVMREWDRHMGAGVFNTRQRCVCRGKEYLIVR